MTKHRAESIATSTYCRRRYLNGLDGALYWSDYPDKDERDDPDGGPFHATPNRAIESLHASIGFLVFCGVAETTQREETHEG